MSKSLADLIASGAATRLRAARRSAGGREGNDKGKMHEDALLAACEALCAKYPTRFYGARKASKEEDAHGMDVIVASPMGDLYLQCKSSKFAVIKFRAQRRPQIIECVLIRSLRADIEALALSALTRCEARVREARGFR